MTTGDAEQQDERRDVQFRAWQVPEGYVRIEHEPGSALDGQDALRELAACEQVASSLPTPLWVDIRGVRSVTREARKAFADSSVPSRVVMFVDSSLTRTMANFFIGVARPGIPVKVFSDADDALEWLLDHEG